MESLTRKTVYPLNSKRIKLAQLRQLAQALELPVTASGANLQIMVEERLRELERVPENVQLVIEEIPGGSENLQLQDERGIFLETTSPKCSKASSPVEVQQSSSLLTGSPGTISEQSSELGPIDQKPPESTDVLRQFTKEQELSAMDYQQLLSDAEERAAELLATNQQLTATLANVQERMAKLASENEHLYSKNEQLLCQLTAHSELLTTNQQLTATLAEVKGHLQWKNHP